jgi:hypothetical protein
MKSLPNMDEMLAPYFEALRRTPLLNAHQELALAREIDRLIVAHWRALLSYGRALPHVALAVENILPERPRALRSACTRPVQLPGAALMRIATRLRRLDSSGAALRAAHAAVQTAFAGDRRAAGYLQRVARAHAAE